MKGDVLRGVPRRTGDRQRREDAIGKAGRPLQHLHAAHRAARHGEQAVDPEMIEQHGLRTHHVANGDDGKFQAPWLAGGGAGRSRAGRSHATAQHVRADHKIALGIDRAAWTDHGLPPAALARHRMHIGDMLVAGQRVADQDRIAALGIERAVGLVGDLERRKLDARVEPQRLVGAKAHQLRTRGVGLARAISRSKCDARLGHQVAALVNHRAHCKARPSLNRTVSRHSMPRFRGARHDRRWRFR